MSWPPTRDISTVVSQGWDRLSSKHWVVCSYQYLHEGWKVIGMMFLLNKQAILRSCDYYVEWHDSRRIRKLLARRAGRHVQAGGRSVLKTTMQ